MKNKTHTVKSDVLKKINYMSKEEAKKRGSNSSFSNFAKNLGK